MFRNTTNATLNYYKGIIRELDSKLKNALVRINNLEKQLKKLAQVTPVIAEDYGSVTNEEAEQFAPTYAETTGGGLSESDVRKIVNEAIEQKLLKIPIHDHTADDKGGDCYASLGASLQ